MKIKLPSARFNPDLVRSIRRSHINTNKQIHLLAVPLKAEEWRRILIEIRRKSLEEPHLEAAISRMT